MAETIFPASAWLDGIRRGEELSHRSGGVQRGRVVLWSSAGALGAMVEVDVDGSLRGNRRGTLGGVLWSEEQGVLASWKVGWRVGSSDGAELRAAWLGLSHAQSVCPGHPLRCWTDASSVLDTLSKNVLPRHFARFREALPAVEVVWVPRWCLPEAHLFTTRAHPTSARAAIDARHPSVGIPDRLRASARGLHEKEERP